MSDIEIDIETVTKLRWLGIQKKIDKKDYKLTLMPWHGSDIVGRIAVQEAYCALVEGDPTISEIFLNVEDLQSLRRGINLLLGDDT